MKPRFSVKKNNFISSGTISRAFSSFCAAWTSTQGSHGLITRIHQRGSVWKKNTSVLEHLFVSGHWGATINHCRLHTLRGRTPDTRGTSNDVSPARQAVKFPPMVAEDHGVIMGWDQKFSRAAGCAVKNPDRKVASNIFACTKSRETRPSDPALRSTSRSARTLAWSKRHRSSRLKAAQSCSLLSRTIHESRNKKMTKPISNNYMQPSSW